MIAAGPLDRRVTILEVSQPSTSYSDAEQAKTFTTIATVWARVEPVIGNEQTKIDGLSDVERLTVTIRYRDDITQANLIQYRGNKFRITSLQELNRREGLKLDCWRDLRQ